MPIKLVEKDRNQNHFYGGNKSGLIFPTKFKDIKY